ncbi:MAG: ThiF family adenylyltransferase [Verrucomicrobiia bacterium]
MGSAKTCLFRITASDREKLQKLLFKRYPHREWGSFLRFGYRIAPWGIHLSFVDAIEPRPGDLKRTSAIVEFSASYILRAQLALADTKLGVGVIHSHPQGCSTHASSLDNDMDDYFAREFAAYGGGRPYVSLRVAHDSDDTFRFSGEAWLNGEQMPVTELLTVGKELERDMADSCVPTNNNLFSVDEQTARLTELIGQRAGRLRNSAVAVVGCSGLGSPAVHVLARAGVRRFVLVDPEFFAPSNHERMHGSTWRDLDTKPLKVEILRRLILDIEPSAEVTTIRGNVLDEAVLDELLRCDLVLGCTDSQHSRAALGDFASHYLLPCIDAAVLMRADNGKLSEQVGEIARYSSDEPCPWCLARIDQKALAYELMTEEEREQRARAAADAIQRGIDGAQYWGDKPPRELTVGYMTTAVGAIQAGYAEGWLTGAGSMPHQRFQFDLGMPLLGVVPDHKTRKPECSCNRTKGWGDQARAERSVTMPAHWPGAEVISEEIGLSSPLVTEAQSLCGR